VVLQSVTPVSSTLGGSPLRDPPSPLSDTRLIHTTTVCRDIDQAAKYIGAGAATVGVAGSGTTTLYADQVDPRHYSPC